MPNYTPTFLFPLPLVNNAIDQDQWGGYLNDGTQLVENQLLTRTANYDFADFELTRPVLKDYSEKLNDLGNQAGATVTVDMTLGNHVAMVLTGNISTLTINNPPPTGKAGMLILYITQDGTGGRTFTFPASVKWAGGSAPTVTSAAAATDVFTFVTRNAGSTWIGLSSGQGFTGL